jgi:hypothetical protein
MNDLSAITHRLFTEAQRAVETLDRNHAVAVKSIATALLTADADRQERMGEVRKAREEAARIVAQSIRDEEEAEREWQAAIDRIDRGLREMAPEPVAMLKAE